MIQRIQTIFLLLVFISCVLIFFFPIAGNLSNQNETNFYELYVYILKIWKHGSKPEFNYFITLPLLIANLIIAVLSVITIFLYKNRIRQMSLIKIAVFINILMVVGIYFGYAEIIERRIDLQEEYDVGAIFPLISLVFLILSFRRIRRDEKMVRASERLR